MTIEDKIKELGIKKMLIADDTPKNIDAAKQYFNKEIAKYGMAFTYVTSEKEAVSAIKNAAANGEKFDFVMSDLEMEQEDSGINVLRNAYANGSQGVIVTGFNYNSNQTGGHGPNTTVKSVYTLSENVSFSGKKSNPEIWKNCFEIVMSHLPESKIHKSLKRYDKFHDKRSENILKLIKGYDNY